MGRPKKGDQYRTNEIRITNIPIQVHTDLINISENLGISLSTLLKPELRRAVEKYAGDLRNPPKKV